MTNLAPQPVQQLVRMKGISSRELRYVREQLQTQIKERTYAFASRLMTARSDVKNRTENAQAHVPAVIENAKHYLTEVDPQVDALNVVQDRINYRGNAWSALWFGVGAGLAALSANYGTARSFVFAGIAIAIGLANRFFRKSTDKFLQGQGVDVALYNAREIGKRNDPVAVEEFLKKS